MCQFTSLLTEHFDSIFRQYILLFRHISIWHMHTAYYLKLLKSLTYSEHSILRLLHYTVTLSIAKILHNYDLNSKS